MTSVRVLVVALGALSVAADVGCANVVGIPDERPYEPGTVCPGAIPIKLLADLTGPTSDVGVPYFKGEMDSIREINATGGIQGCTLEVEAKDYGYDPVGAGGIYDAWKKQPEFPRVAAILGWGTGDTFSLAPKVRDDKKPMISASYAGVIAAPEPLTIRVDEPRLVATFEQKVFPAQFKAEGYPYNFFAGTDYSTGGRIAMFHLVTLGAKRVGFGYCTKNRYCFDPIAAIHSHAASLGIPLGRDLPLELDGTQASYDDLVLKYFREEKAQQAKDPGYVPVDWLWMGNTVKTTVYLAKSLDRVKAELGLDVQLIVNNWGFDESTASTCGASCAGRVHGIMPFVAYGERVPEMAKVMALNDKYRAIDKEPLEKYRNVRYVQGYVSVMVLKIAIERVLQSGKAITGPNVKAALETFSNVDLGGLCEKISFSPKDHRPQSTEAVYKIGPAGNLVLEPPSRTIAMDPAWLGW